jgi:uncharacterized membrane protein
MTTEWIELAAAGIESLAVVIIVVAILHGTGRFLLHLRQRLKHAYQSYKVQLGKTLLLGLELLVAADVLRTVALDANLANVSVLALLVIVRTILSWSIVVEIEGRWPWRVADAESRPADRGRGAEDHG